MKDEGGMKNDESKSKALPRPHFSSLIAQHSSLLLYLVVFVVLLYGVVYPNLHILTASLQAGGGWSLGNYREALSHSTTFEATVSSVVLSLLTVLFCAVVGVSLAFLFERYTFPGRGLSRRSTSGRPAR